MSAPTPIVLVGAGHIASAVHLPALVRLQEQGLVAVTVADADESRAKATADRFGLQAVARWQDAEAEAVVACVPPGPNVDIVLEALSRGQHVMTEKPPARSVEQARELADAAAAHPELVTMVGFNRRYSPLYRTALDASLEVAPPTSFYGRFSRNALGESPSNTAADWITSDSSHGIDLAVATVGFPDSVTVSRRSIGEGPANVWELLFHGRQGSALLLFHYAAGQRVERFEWVGPGYDAVVDPPVSAAFARRNRTTEWSGAELCGTDDGFVTMGFLGEHEAFAAAVRGEAPRPAPDLAHGERIMTLIETVLGAGDGETVAVAPRTPPEPEPAGRAAAARRSKTQSVVFMHRFADHQRYFSMEDLDAISRDAEVHWWDGDASVLDTATVVVAGRGGSPLPDDFVDRCTELELLVALGTTVEPYQPELLAERGVVVRNTGRAIARLVAEHCLLLALAGLRQLPATDAVMHHGGWPRPAGPPKSLSARAKVATKKSGLPAPVKDRLKATYQTLQNLRRKLPGGAPPTVPAIPAQELRGAAVGMIGWGHIAREFAALLEPFDVRLVVYSEHATDDDLAASGATRGSLGEILASCRVISLHRNLDDHTRGMLDAARLDQIPAGRVLVNTARGGLIDEQALAARLRRGDMVAALDVYEHEPLDPESPLRELANAILTPHHASTTTAELTRMGADALGTVRAHLADRVDP